jgi:hypothetical protein
MNLTIQDVHAYQELVAMKLVPSIEYLLGDTSDYPDLMLPELNENDEVVFYSVIGTTKVTPGLNTIETILTSIEDNKEVLKNP